MPLYHGEGWLTESVSNEEVKRTLYRKDAVHSGTRQEIADIVGKEAFYTQATFTSCMRGFLELAVASGLYACPHTSDKDIRRNELWVEFYVHDNQVSVDEPIGGVGRVVEEAATGAKRSREDE